MKGICAAVAAVVLIGGVARADIVCWCPATTYDTETYGQTTIQQGQELLKLATQRGNLNVLTQIEDALGAVGGGLFSGSPVSAATSRLHSLAGKRLTPPPSQDAIQWRSSAGQTAVLTPPAGSISTKHRRLSQASISRGRKSRWSPSLPFSRKTPRF